MAKPVERSAAVVDMHFLGADKPPLRCKHKQREKGNGFRCLDRWMGGADVIFLKRRRDQAEPLVVMTWAAWERVVDNG